MPNTSVAIDRSVPKVVLVGPRGCGVLSQTLGGSVPEVMLVDPKGCGGRSQKSWGSVAGDSKQINFGQALTSGLNTSLEPMERTLKVDLLFHLNKSALEEELTVQADIELKSRAHGQFGNLLTKEKYPNMRTCATSLTALFGSPYASQPFPT